MPEPPGDGAMGASVRARWQVCSHRLSLSLVKFCGIHRTDSTERRPEGTNVPGPLATCDLIVLTDIGPANPAKQERYQTGAEDRAIQVSVSIQDRRQRNFCSSPC